MQLDAGAVGITVAKIGEAEVLPGDDVLIAYPIMADKLPRLRALAQAGRRVTVVVDSVEAARGAARHRRHGRGGRGRRPLRRRDARAGGGHRPRLLRVPRPVLLAVVDRRGRASRRRAGVIDGHIAALKAAGFDVPIVSGGSTPGARQDAADPGHHRDPPRHLRLQRRQLRGQQAGHASRSAPCACWSRWSAPRSPGQCVVDGGTKTFSGDATVNVGTHGIFPDRPDWTMLKMNEEHGYVNANGSPARDRREGLGRPQPRLHHREHARRDRLRPRRPGRGHLPGRRARPGALSVTAGPAAAPIRDGRRRQVARVDAELGAARLPVIGATVTAAVTIWRVPPEIDRVLT